MKERYLPVQTKPGASVSDIGTVIDINPKTFTADVVLKGGRSMQGVAFVGLYGSPFGQDLTWLQNLRGAVVKLTKIDGEYFIIHTLPTELVDSTKEHQYSIPATQAGVGGDDNLTYKKGTFADYSGNRNTAFLPSDKEGVVRLRAGALAQLLLGRYKDFARLVTRVYQFFSDFGEMNSTHDAGRVGLHIKGGADFKEETHPNMKKWTVQVWYGDFPDDPNARLHIRVNDADNTEYVTLQYGIDGCQVLDMSQDDTQTVGNDRDHVIVNDESVTVGGNASKMVTGDTLTTVSGNAINQVTGNDTQNITGSWTINVVGAASIISASKITLTAPSISLN